MPAPGLAASLAAAAAAAVPAGANAGAAADADGGSCLAEGEWQSCGAEEGWAVDRELGDSVAALGCDLEVVDDADALSAADFAARFRHRAPVVLRGAAALAALRNATATKPALLRHLRGLDVMPVAQANVKALSGTTYAWVDTSALPLDEFVETFSERGMSMFEFAQRGPSAVRDRPDAPTRDMFGLDDASWPPPPLAAAFPRRGSGAPRAETVGIFASGRGLPIHEHAETYNALVQGTKLWVLWPPGGLEALGAEAAWAVWPENVQLAAALPAVADLRPLQCVQHPGDVIYIPEYWWHGTMSIGDTVSFAEQQSQPTAPAPAGREREGEETSCRAALRRAGPAFDAAAAREYGAAAQAAPWCPRIAGRWAKAAWRSALPLRGPLRLHREHVRRVAAARAAGAVSAAQAAKELRVAARSLLETSDGLRGGRPATPAAKKKVRKVARAMLEAGLQYDDEDPHILQSLTDVALNSGAQADAAAYGGRALRALEQRRAGLAAGEAKALGKYDRMEAYLRQVMRRAKLSAGGSRVTSRW